MTKFWKKNWPKTKKRFEGWWKGKDLIVSAWPGSIGNMPPMVPNRHEEVEGPGLPQTPWQKWADADWRAKYNEWFLSQQNYNLDTIPLADTKMGPGSLAMILGSNPLFQENTVWFEPIEIGPDCDKDLEFDENNKWWKAHYDLVNANIQKAQKRYIVGSPDLQENLDILAILRGTENLLLDTVENPNWIKEKIHQINKVFFSAYQRIYELIKDDEGGSAGSALRLWAPGKVAKVQCDLACMISPESFQKFVIPGLKEQCEWLDFSLFHLDGVRSIMHLDSLLDIEQLNAVQWTPGAGNPQGGDPKWFEMYKKIKNAGKSVQVVHVKPDEVIPLIDAIGKEGLYIFCDFKNENQISRMVKELKKYKYEN